MKFRFISVLAAIVISATGSAQSVDGYFIGKNFVSYNDSLMKDADVATFIVLGHGVAKDKNHVYNEGRIMEYADKNTTTATTQPAAIEPKANDDSDDDNNSIFDRLLGTDEIKSKYAVKDGVVTYDGKPVKKADAATFQYVGGEYAADKHHAYYKGRILSDAWGLGQFKYKGNGTATDGVHYYSNGLPVDRD